MKLRHKASGIVVEGDFVRNMDGYGEFWCKRYREGCRYDSSWYHENEWERVPEERWVQVPVGLLNDGRSVSIPNAYGGHFTLTLPSGYRWLDGGVIVQRKECC